MKKKVVILVFAVFLSLISNSKDKLLLNDTKDGVTISSIEGKVTFLEPSESHKILDVSPLYLMTLQDNDSAAVITRNGFVDTNRQKDTLFVSQLKPIDCYLENLSYEEISVDYGVYTVFIPSGATRKLEGLVLNQDKSSILTLRNFINGDFGKPLTREVSFDYKNGRMLAKQ